jgi:2-polyprenyl-6-methoxyphenol hydroxylase-like FAD-dependent oxidoreductase
MDLPQTLLEPILVGYAMQHGLKARFNTQFLSFQRDNKNGTILTSVKDLLTQRTYSIQSRYLFGADGAKSNVLRQLGIPLIKQPGQGLAINVLVKADLSHLMEHRMGNLHWIIQPDVEHPSFAWIGIVRMVKP